MHVCSVHKSAEHNFRRTLEHAGPSLYGAALTTAGSAAPLLATEIVLFRKMGEYIVVCTAFSLAVGITFIAPLVHLFAPRRRKKALEARERGDGSLGERGSLGAVASPESSCSVSSQARAAGMSIDDVLDAVALAAEPMSRSMSRSPLDPEPVSQRGAQSEAPELDSGAMAAVQPGDSGSALPVAPKKQVSFSADEI